MRIVLGILGLFVILIAGFLIYQAISKTNSGTVTVNKHTYTVEVAKTPKDKQTGLSKKPSLSDNAGMVFPFDTADYHPFWMKNMKFPIDIIFLRNNQIITVYKNVPAPTSDSDLLPLYQPTEPANMVLELKAGQADKYNIKTGDTITTKNISTK